jgi:signal transduction histidine kinase
VEGVRLANAGPPATRIDLDQLRLEGAVLNRWQRYWSALFFVLLAVSAGVAVAGLASGPRRGAVLVLSGCLALWYWHEVIRTGRALSGRVAALPGLAAAAALWAPLLVLHPIFQLLIFNAYHLACSAPAPMRRAVPRIAVVSAVVVATTSVRAGFQPLDLVFYGAVTLALGLLVAMMQAIDDQSEQRRRLLEQLESARGELAAAERRAGVLAERQRLAREIHDTLAQGFASIVTLSEAARAQARGSPEVAMRRLEEAGQVARSSLAQARRAIWALRPEALERGSLGHALGELAADFGSQTGIEAHSAVTGEEADLGPAAQEALLRVAQEALANVRKHARAHRVQLTLSYLDDATLLDVRDDGTGFDPAAPARNGSGGGFGLAGMRERLAAHGGTLTIETAPGQGTSVAAALPRGPAIAGQDR